MKVFSISNINIENGKVKLVSNFTTIISIRAVGRKGLTLFYVIIIQKSVEK